MDTLARESNSMDTLARESNAMDTLDIESNSKNFALQIVIPHYKLHDNRANPSISVI